MSYGDSQTTLTPIVLVNIENERLPDNVGIISFEYEEIDDGDDKISVSIADPYGKYIDDERFQIRNKISVRWGYPGQLSPERHGILLEPEPEFSQSMIIHKLIAHDEGSKLHGRSDQKVWNRVKHSEIAAEIARKHNLKTSIKETNKVLETEPQGNKSDYEFLTYLASQNNYDFYIDIDTLHFHPKIKNKRAVFTVNRKSSDWFNKYFIEFRPRINTQQEKAEGTETTAIGFDPIKREAIEHKSNSGTKQEAALGPKSLMINLGSGDTKFNETETGHIQATPHNTLEQVEAESETQRTNAEDNQVEADLTIIGLPTLRAKNIIEVLGVGKKYSGRYYIKSIRHQIDSGGYKCFLELTRDAVDEEKNAADQKEIQNQGSDGENPEHEDTVDMIQMNLETGEEVKK